MFGGWTGSQYSDQLSLLNTTNMEIKVLLFVFSPLLRKSRSLRTQADHTLVWPYQSATLRKLRSISSPSTHPLARTTPLYTYPLRTKSVCMGAGTGNSHPAENRNCGSCQATGSGKSTRGTLVEAIQVWWLTITEEMAFWCLVV